MKRSPSPAGSTTARHPRALRPRGAARVIDADPDAAASPDGGGIVAHPDGYYWLGPDGNVQVGPFDSARAARADRDRYNEQTPEEGESVQEAELELGLNDWIDAETGAPAEGQSPPHLEER